MMDVLEAIFSRRSVRSYNDQPVNEETIQVLLKAAMQAPSARNMQPWQFLVITERKLLTEIPHVHPYAKMIANAALGILICADETCQPNELRWCQDLGAATENLLLAARGLGLGAVWLGVYGTTDRSQGIRNLFNLPAHIHPYSLVSIGYSDQEPPAEDRYKPERVRFNQW